MNTLGNLIWILLCGFWVSLTWVIFGVFWCLTIVGIPIGLQCFKFAAFSLAPFGKDILLAHNSTSFILNLLWIIFGGLEIAVTCAVIGLLFCISIIGIPFGYQCFKLAKLALMPFGAEIIYSK